MKYEKCMVDISVDEGAKAQMTLPKGIFTNISSGKCIVIKRSNSDVLKLFSIPKATKVYELYAEIAYAKLSRFVIEVTNLMRDNDKVQIIPDVSDGGCPGSEKDGLPCTFNAFLTVKGGDEMKTLDAIEERLVNLRGLEGESIIKSVSISLVK